MTPVYEATATLLIESEQANVVSIEEVYGIDSSQREYYQTQFEILSSRRLAERVIDDLGIRNHSEFDPDNSESTSIRGTLMGYIPLLPPSAPASEDQKWQGVVGLGTKAGRAGTKAGRAGARAGRAVWTTQIRH